MGEIKLKDLGEMVSSIRNRISQEFSNKDVYLSSTFQAAFADNVSESGNTIEFEERTATMTNSGGLKIYMPNQWFILAAFAVDFVKEIIKYRNLTEGMLDEHGDDFRANSGKIMERKEIYKTLKMEPNGTIAATFKKDMHQYLLTLRDQSIDEDEKNLYRFVSDSSWWLGGKGIERTNDFYVSPILGSLNLVNASQNYVATITYAYANDDNLYKSLETMVVESPEVGKSNEESGDENMNLKKPFTEPVYHTGLEAGYPLNRIIFGAPGTGKSYGLEQDRKIILHENNSNPKEQIGAYERVTFHPDYTYSQFVGTYKPVSEGKEIYYKFIPGPFMRIFVKAIENGKTDNPQPYVLLIEEINRAPVAAVFGDVFQLLDRDSDGVSQYEIETSEDIRRYLAEKLGGNPDQYEKIRIPDNMFIWATMNSADQGVFPMDTAFKRRWDFTYLGVDENDQDIRDKYVVVGSLEKQRIKWNDLRKAINTFLAELKVNEDKQLGPYFISRNIVAPDNNEIDSNKFAEVFKNKVIMYLFEDAARQKRSEIFKGSARGWNRYSQICQAFDEQGIGIFHENIQNAIPVIEDLSVNGHEKNENGESEE